MKRDAFNRLVIEQRELNEKVTKLGEFLGKILTGMVHSLSEANVYLLRKQYEAQTEYNQILIARIELNQNNLED